MVRCFCCFSDSSVNWIRIIGEARIWLWRQRERNWKILGFFALIFCKWMRVYSYTWVVQLFCECVYKCNQRRRGEQGREREWERDKAHAQRGRDCRHVIITCAWIASHRDRKAKRHLSWNLTFLCPLCSLSRLVLDERRGLSRWEMCATWSNYKINK